MPEPLKLSAMDRSTPSYIELTIPFCESAIDVAAGTINLVNDREEILIENGMIGYPRSAVSGNMRCLYY